MIKRWVLFFCYTETIGFEGNYVDLKQGLSRTNNDFYMEWRSRKQIGLQAIEWVGTFRMLSGIRVYATIQNTQANQLQIRLQGQINYEVLFFQAISVLMLLGVTANAIATVSLSILCCIFFNAFFSCMYYFQQRNLCYKFRRFVQA